MKITKKELFKFCDENNDAINELQSQSDSTDFLLAVLIQQLKDSGVIDEISPEPKPQLKQLDQSVFDGAYKIWRFASVDADGAGFRFAERPELTDCFWRNVNCSRFDRLSQSGTYDASNWQNSLIERDTAKELTGSDLARVMLARGDKYISGFGHHHSDKLALEAKFADTVSKHTQCFQSSQNAWDYFVPINNQGEPLTQAEAGL